MNILKVSDLHNEFYRAKNVPTPDLSPPGDIDLLVFAGDIDKGVRGMEFAISQSLKFGVPAVYIPGNHEFYGANYYSTLRKMEALTKNSAVTLLSDKVTVINGVQFIGATLWTDYDVFSRQNRKLIMMGARSIMTDYAKIRLDVKGRYSKLTPADTVRLHAQSISFIESTLEKDFNGPRVVVTHHAPSMHSLAPSEREDDISAAYASDLSLTMKQYEIDMWMHGHTHRKVDYNLEGVRVYANPRGYPGELAAYKEEVIVLNRNLKKNAQPVY